MNDTVNEKFDAFVKESLVGSYNKIFVVDVNTGRFQVYKNDGLLDDYGLDGAEDVFAYMQLLIDNKIVYPQQVTACKRFTNPEYVRNSLFSGEKRIVQTYRRRTSEGDKWVTFAIIAVNGCSPENPIVLYTWRAADAEAITLLDTLPTISSMYDKLIRINLTNNTFEPVIVGADEQERLVGGVINMHVWWDSYSKDANIHPDDRPAFATLTKSGSLRERFAEDSTPVSIPYRRIVNGEYRWLRLEIAPSVEYSEENQIMLLSLKDIHEEYEAQRRSRQELIDNMNADALTGLYNRLKFNYDLEKLSKSSEPLFTCLYVDVNGLHELNNHLGHQKGDEMLCRIADTLKKYFPNEKVYRIGGDEFVVTSTAESKRSMELTIEDVRRELLKFNYEISIGIETGACGSSIEKIVDAAELAMRNDKAAYYMRNGDRRRKRQMNEELEQMLVEKHDSERFLNVIAREFSGVYFVDLARDSLRHIYIPEHFSKLLQETDDRFSEAMKLYVERFVDSEHRDRFDDIVDYEKLDEKLKESEAVQFTYKKTDGMSMNVRILEVDRRKNSKPETIWIFAEEN